MNPLNDKKYKEVLQAFAFYSEINPVNTIYDEAINLIDKVLPYGYEKVDEKVHKESNITMIYYKTEKGNFIVHLPHALTETENGEIIFDEEQIAGISYYLEVE